MTTPLLDALAIARAEREQHDRARLDHLYHLVRGPLFTLDEPDHDGAVSILNRDLGTADTIVLDGAGWPVMTWE